MTPRVFVKPGNVLPIWSGHPWVYSQAIARVDGRPEAGEVVEVHDTQGNLLGRGFWSPGSAIPIRIVTRDADDPLDDASLARRVEAAVRWRRELLGLPDDVTTGLRLIHAEGDDLPGLIADRYGDCVAVQFGTIGMKQREEAIYDALAAAAGVSHVVEMSGGAAQRREGIESQTRVVRGGALAQLTFRDRGFSFSIPLEAAQKTGFFFDQRPQRERVESLATGRRVLDAYSYLGGFGLAAARGGATEVVAVDRSAPALEACRAAAGEAGLGDRLRTVADDVRRVLPDLARSGERFDFVVLDPPKLAPSSRHLERALGAYERLNSLALQLLSPGGLLLSCSCSGAVSDEALLRVVGRAAARERRCLRLLGLGGQGADHPTPPVFREGRYLSALWFLAE